MILRGILKLGRGDAKGMAEFSGAKEAFSASLAPLIAFPLVGAVITAISGDWQFAVIGLLSRLCSVLALPLIVYEFSRIFDRTSLWLRAATALNWCFWLVLPGIFIAAILGSVLIQAGLPMTPVETVLLGGVGFYLLWNRWFVFKAGLQLNGWQALLMLLVSLLITGLFAMLPWIGGMHLPSASMTSLP